MNKRLSTSAVRSALMTRLMAVFLVTLAVSPFTAPFSAAPLADVAGEHPTSEYKTPLKDLHDVCDAGLPVVVASPAPTSEARVERVKQRVPLPSAPRTLVLRI